jgi:glutathione synthase/RimK-type ligase-like ATP-grasp enzyme
MEDVTSIGQRTESRAARAPDQGREKQIAYLYGNDDQHGLIPPGTKGISTRGQTDIWELRSGDIFDFLRIHIPANFQRLRVKPQLNRARLVLNLVTDPDINPIVLGHAHRYLKGYKGRVINRPDAVLGSTRDQQARLLAEIGGLIAPRTARFLGRLNLAVAAIERTGLQFPAILRLVGTHGGQVLGLMRDREMLLEAIKADHAYYLTEFVDSRIPGGLYQKIRVFYFGETPIVRHRLVSDRWNIHAADRARVLATRPADIRFERALMEDGFVVLPNAVQETLKKIRARVALDFFGIDFTTMPDGRVLMFEANATMSFFPIIDKAPFDYAGPMVERARRAFDNMLTST